VVIEEEEEEEEEEEVGRVDLITWVGVGDLAALGAGLGA